MKLVYVDARWLLDDMHFVPIQHSCVRAVFVEWCVSQCTLGKVKL